MCLRSTWQKSSTASAARGSVAGLEQGLHVRRRARHAEETGFAVDEVLDRRGVVSLVRQEMHEDARVEVAAPRAHHQAAGGREAHGRVHGTPVAYGRQARAIAEVRNDGPAERRGAQRGEDVLVGEPMEPAALDAPGRQRARQRQAVSGVSSAAKMPFPSATNVLAVPSMS
jgi:hypothetical protein